MSKEKIEFHLLKEFFNNVKLLFKILRNIWLVTHFHVQFSFYITYYVYITYYNIKWFWILGYEG